MAAARYWKLRIPESNDSSNADILLAEVELRIALGGADQTVAANAVTNSFGSAGFYSGAEGPDKAFNDNTANWWQPRIPGGSYVELGWDFGAGNDKDIIEVAMTANASFYARTPKKFSLLSSSDNSTYTAIWGTQDIGTWSTPTRVFNTPITPDLSAYVYEVAAEILDLPPSTDAQIAQLAAEIVSGGFAQVQVSSTALEVLRSTLDGPSSARVQSIALEVLRAVAVDAGGRRRMSLM